jgi:hypothetical protein
MIGEGKELDGFQRGTPMLIFGVKEREQTKRERRRKD